MHSGWALSRSPQSGRGDDVSNTAIKYSPAQKSIDNDQHVAADPTSFRREKRQSIVALRTYPWAHQTNQVDLGS